MKMISANEAKNILGITKETLLKWHRQKKIKAHELKISGRIYLGFNSEEVYSLKKRMVQKRINGKALLI